MSRRFIVQRVLTDEFLEWELPLKVDEISWDLSGPGSLRGSISPEYGRLIADDGELLLQEWGSFIYEEIDGEIRWGGILIHSEFAGPIWSIEAAGFSSYLNGVPFLDVYRDVNAEPIDVVNRIWSHVQSYPEGSIGVTLTGETTTPVKLGKPAVIENGKVKEEKEPYELVWWEATDCGDEVDNLAKQTPFDYTEHHRWDGNGGVIHEVEIGYPRLGRKRDDLSFAEGENIVSSVPYRRPGDEFANEVMAVGKGEGRKTRREKVPHRDGRLRRPHVVSDKSIGTSHRLRALAGRELQERSSTDEITGIVIENHPNAPFGSWQVGDDILVRAEIPWVGDVAMWSRIISWSRVGDKAALKLRRSDKFVYGSK